MELITLKARDTFLANLRMVMDDRGLSYSDLGELAGMTKQRIYEVFHGKSNLSLNTTEKLAAALKIKETDLFNPNFKINIKS